MSKQDTRVLISSVGLLFGHDTRIKTQLPRAGTRQDYYPPTVSNVDSQRGRFNSSLWICRSGCTLASDGSWMDGEMDITHEFGPSPNVPCPWPGKQDWDLCDGNSCALVDPGLAILFPQQPIKAMRSPCSPGVCAWFPIPGFIYQGGTATRACTGGLGGSSKCQDKRGRLTEEARLKMGARHDSG